MGFLKRILGICATRPPRDAGCWSYAEGRLFIDLARAPELAAIGGAVRLEGGGLPLRVLVFNGPNDAFHAFANQCPHAGRRLDPMEDGSRVQCCSVGKSTFDLEGNRLSGSAKGPVKALALSVQGQSLLINLP